MKFRALTSLRARLLLLVFISIIPVLIYLFYNASEQKRHQEAEIKADTLHWVKIASNSIEELTDGSRQVLSVLSKIPAVRNRDSSACNAFFADLKKVLVGYDNIFAANLDGDIYCSANTFAGEINVADRQWFQRPIQSGKFSFGRYQRSRISRRPVIAAGLPVLDGEGNLKAVAGMSINLSTLTEKLAGIRIPPTATVFAIDREGTILSRNLEPEMWIGKKMSDSGLVKSILTRKEGIIESADIDGIKRLYAFVPVQGTDDGIFICLGISPEVAFAVVGNKLMKELAWLGVLAIIASLAAWFGGDFLVLRRMKGLMKATDELSNGNLGARVEISGESDEIGQLEQSFNKMASTIESDLRERRKAEESLVRAITARKLAEAELKRVNRALKTISKCSEALVHAVDESAFLRKICEILVEDGGYRMAWIGHAEPEGDKRVLPLVHAGHENGYLSTMKATWQDVELGRGPAGTAIRTHSYCVHNDIRTHPDFAPWREEALKRGYSSTIAFPLIVDEQCFGVLTFYASEQDVFIGEEISLLKELADDVAFGILMIRMREERRKGQKELKKSHELLHSLAAHLQSVREEERANIAREVHDELGQILTVLKFNLFSIATKLKNTSEPLHTAVSANVELIDKTIKTVKKICTELRPGILDHLGLGPAIEWQVHEFQERSGIECELVLSSEEVTDDKNMGIALFRILQEALTNILRHSKATKVRVVLARHDNNIVFEISDNGIGITEADLSKSNSFGLVGMRERVYPWKGEVQISGVRDKGTIIRISIPKDKGAGLPYNNLSIRKGA